jgi:hypothetical protein
MYCSWDRTRRRVYGGLSFYPHCPIGSFLKSDIVWRATVADNRTRYPIPHEFSHVFFPLYSRTYRRPPRFSPPHVSRSFIYQYLRLLQLPFTIQRCAFFSFSVLPLNRFTLYHKIIYCFYYITKVRDARIPCTVVQIRRVYRKVRQLSIN